MLLLVLWVVMHLGPSTGVVDFARWMIAPLEPSDRVLYVGWRDNECFLTGDSMIAGLSTHMERGKPFVDKERGTTVYPVRVHYRLKDTGEKYGFMDVIYWRKTFGRWYISRSTAESGLPVYWPDYKPTAQPPRGNSSRDYGTTNPL